jgi:hypothetical protein
MLTTFAIFAFVSPATALTREQEDVLERIASIAVASPATTELPHLCPRFKQVDGATIKERRSVGIPDDFRYTRSDEFDAFIKMAYGNYHADPSGYCLEIWKLYGPDGTYKRQMVEPAD